MYVRTNQGLYSCKSFGRSLQTAVMTRKGEALTRGLDLCTLSIKHNFPLINNNNRTRGRESLYTVFPKRSTPSARICQKSRYSHCNKTKHIIQQLSIIKLKRDTASTIPSTANLGFNFEKIPIVDRIEFEQAKTKHRKLLRSHTLPHGAW